jgi:two-component system heavy metal sensor histidine kinase CusS
VASGSVQVRERGARAHVPFDGPPIAAAHQPRIFERFYRADAARQDSASGSGLGLAIVRSILEMHGGTAAVDSGPGRATVFVLQFPGKPLTASS